MKKIWLWLLAALVFYAAPAGAEDKPYVVLALSGGGIKGYAHIGVLQELEKEGVGIAGIVGTSMGPSSAVSMPAAERRRSWNESSWMSISAHWSRRAAAIISTCPTKLRAISA